MMTLDRWFPFLILVAAIGAIIGLPWLVFFTIAVSLIVLITHFWRQNALKNIHYWRQWKYKRGFPGEITQVKIHIDNQKWLPLSWLRTLDHWPVHVAPEEKDNLAPSHIRDETLLVSSLSMRWFQRVTRDYQVKFQERGVYRIGPVRMESGDVFGMFETSKEIEQFDDLVVFPELIPFSHLLLPAENPFGDRSARRRLFEDPNITIGVRGYHPEDDFRRIHWNATARTNDLQVKVFQPVSSKIMVVCLNVATMEYSWLGTSPEALEYLVKIGATLCYQGIQDGYAVGLVSNGVLAHSDQPFRINPGRTQDHLAVLLQSLAGVTPFTTIPFENYLLKAVPQTPIGATLVIVSSIVTPSLLESLLLLKKYRPHITFISTASEPPLTVPGVQTIHLPISQFTGVGKS